MLSSRHTFRKHCSSSCSIFRKSTVFFSCRPCPPLTKIVLRFPISFDAVMVRSRWLLLSKQSGLCSLSASRRYSLVTRRRPDDVCSLAWVLSQARALLTEQPLITFLKPSERRSRLQLEGKSILFLLSEFEIIIFDYMENRTLRRVIIIQMKSIRAMENLGSSRDRKPSPLASIEQPLFRSKRQRVQVPCAFHSGETITNFCKHSNCLLPLCPKCVKIHIDEHANSGTYAKFEAIDDCLDEVHGILVDSFVHVSRLQKTSRDIEQAYLRKKEQAMGELDKARTMAYEALAGIFADYEATLKTELGKDDKVFNEGLVEYHDCVALIMEGCRTSTKKFSSKNTLMQGLISFYSKQDLNLQLKLCEQKLSRILTTKLQITTHPFQLQKLPAIIRGYLHLGTPGPAHSHPVNPGHSRTRSQAAKVSPLRTAPQDSEVSLLSVPDALEAMRTPLDGFSLEKSRQLRITMNRTRQSEQLL